MARSPGSEPLCLVTYRNEVGALESAAVPTAQRNALHAVGRLAIDHGLVQVGLPIKVLQAALKEVKTVVEANGGKFPVPPPADLWSPSSTG